MDYCYKMHKNSKCNILLLDLLKYDIMGCFTKMVFVIVVILLFLHHEKH